MQTRLSPADSESGKLSFQQIEGRIRGRAYEIFEERGRGEGHVLDDWLEAKAEVLGVVKNPKGRMEINYVTLKRVPWRIDATLKLCEPLRRVALPKTLLRLLQRRDA